MKKNKFKIYQKIKVINNKILFKKKKNRLRKIFTIKKYKQIKIKIKMKKFLKKPKIILMIHLKI